MFNLVCSHNYNYTTLYVFRKSWCTLRVLFWPINIFYEPLYFLWNLAQNNLSACQIQWCSKHKKFWCFLLPQKTARWVTVRFFTLFILQGTLNWLKNNVSRRPFNLKWEQVSFINNKKNLSWKHCGHYRCINVQLFIFI